MGSTFVFATSLAAHLVDDRRVAVAHLTGVRRVIAPDLDREGRIVRAFLLVCRGVSAPVLNDAGDVVCAVLARDRDVLVAVLLGEAAVATVGAILEEPFAFELAEERGDLFLRPTRPDDARLAAVLRD